MTQDNVMEFCQWLIDEKGVEVGKLSEYISEHESDLDELSSQFKKFQNGGVVSKQKPIEKSDKMKYYVDKVMPYRLNKNIAKELNSVSAYNVPNIVHDVDEIRMIPIPTPEHQDVNENSSWGGVEGALKRAINDKSVLSKIGYGSMYFKCGGKPKSINKSQEGGKIVNDKMENIRDRHRLSRQDAYTKGDEAYIMTVGHDLDLFNDFNGKRDTLVRYIQGFKAPKKYSNEDLGHVFETTFPGVANFFGYKSGYQKALDEIEKLKK